MTAERTEQLLLADQDGKYYLLTPEVRQQARVPEPQAAAIRADLAKLGDQNDVAGFSLTVATQAVREESGGRSPTPNLTTLAFGSGEESGGGQAPIRVPFPPPFFRNL